MPAGHSGPVPGPALVGGGFVECAWESFTFGTLVQHADSDPKKNRQYFLTSVAEGLQIIDEVNHPNVKFLYDFYHEQIAEGNLIEKLQENIDKIGVVHIADVPGRHEPGTGEINYPNIFRKLVALNFKGCAAMEFLPTGDPVESLREARKMAIEATAKPTP